MEATPRRRRCGHGLTSGGTTSAESRRVMSRGRRWCQQAGLASQPHKERGGAGQCWATGMGRRQGEERRDGPLALLVVQEGKGRGQASCWAEPDEEVVL